MNETNIIHFRIYFSRRKKEKKHKGHAIVVNPRSICLYVNKTIYNELLCCKNHMMFSLKLCAKKRFQPFIKLILIIAVIGIYFIVLLRESLAAWELTKVKNTNLNSANDVSV